MPIIYKSAWLPLKDRRVLYVRSHGKDVFYNACGKREPGETDIAALRREATEELSVRLKSGSIRLLQIFNAEAHGKPGTQLESRAYAAEYDGELKPQNEIAEMKWFSSTDRKLTTPMGCLILDWIVRQNMID